MSKNIHTVSSSDRVIHARRILIDENIARLPVVDDGTLVGVISDTEIAFAFASIKKSFSLGRQKHQLDELHVGDVMRTPAIWTEPNMSASDASKIMMKYHVGFLPVVEKDKIIGIITRTDLLKTVKL
jgi:CBS domain-containing protein